MDVRLVLARAAKPFRDRRRLAGDVGRQRRDGAAVLPAFRRVRSARDGPARAVTGGRAADSARVQSQANFTANTAAMNSTPAVQSLRRPASTLMVT